MARGRPTAELGFRIRSLMRVHSNPHLMPSFVDNHDVDRFLAAMARVGGTILIPKRPCINGLGA
jgi:hypothetical protein